MHLVRRPGWASLLALALLAATARGAAATPPRLVVIVSVDQLGRDLLDRYAHLFPPGGFRRLIDGGADYVDCHHRHNLTLTGPGHAVMLTGAYPVQTGIIANRWYSRRDKQKVNCVEDDRFPTLEPNATAEEKGFSPLRMQSSTVGDVLRASTAARAKVVSLALKDRVAILLGGWRPTAALWLDEGSCHFTTSTYYGPTVPAWAAALNATEPCSPYLSRQWTKLRSDIDYAKLADVDDAPYEQDAYGLGRAFPHPMNATGLIPQSRYAAVFTSPFGNDVLLSLAKAALDGEQLGADDVPDLLALGFSSNDYIGHLYGPHSQEVLDTTLRTDRMLAELMEHLDRKIGEGRWTIAVVSDHGVAPIPEYLVKMEILPPREDRYRWQTEKARQVVEAALVRRFLGDEPPPAGFSGFIELWDDGSSPFVWLNRGAGEQLARSIGLDELMSAAREAIEPLEGVDRVYTLEERDLLIASDDPFDRSVYRTWHRDNGGDLVVQLKPYWFPTFRTSTTHGSPYAYDTHVPMMLYGAGIDPGRFERSVAVVDLASTVSMLLGIQSPPHNVGDPLIEALSGR